MTASRIRVPGKAADLEVCQGRFPIGRNRFGFERLSNLFFLEGSQTFEMRSVGKFSFNLSPFDLHYRCGFVFEHQMTGTDLGQLPFGRGLKTNSIPGNFFPGFFHLITRRLNPLTGPLARYEKIPAGQFRIYSLPLSLSKSFAVVALLAFVAKPVFFDQRYIRDFDGIAFFFFSIHGVVLQVEADALVLFIDKRPLPGLNNAKGIAAILIRLTESLFKMFEQIFVEFLAGICILELDLYDLTRLGAGSIGNEPAFKTLCNNRR